jgi:hypothetical protein
MVKYMNCRQNIGYAFKEDHERTYMYGVTFIEMIFAAISTQLQFWTKTIYSSLGLLIVG